MGNLFGFGAFGAARPSATRPVLAPENGPATPEDWAKDCSSPLLRDGTEWRAGWANFLTACLRALVRRSGIADDNTDDNLLARAVRSQGLNFANAAAVGGTANAVTLAFSPTFTSLVSLTGTPLRFVAEADATQQPTIAVDGLTATLSVGQLWRSGDFVEAIYDGARFVHQVIGSLFASNPSFPEILSLNNLATFASATATVSIDSGHRFIWRGTRTISTSDFAPGDRSFATVASSFYHFYWHAPGTGTATPATSWPNGRFQLLDVTAASPARKDPSWDTTYDRMFCATVETNASNVPTVTAARNTALPLRADVTRATSATTYATRAAVPRLDLSINWGRTPDVSVAVVDADVGANLEALVAIQQVIRDRDFIRYELTGYEQVSGLYIAAGARLLARA